MSDHTWKLWYSHHMRDRDDCGSRTLRCLTTVWHTLGLTHISIILALILYALVGAFIFLSIERPAEQQRQEETTLALNKQRHDFTETLIAYVSNCTLHQSSSNCSLSVKELIVKYEEETESLRMALPGSYNWSNFWNAVWYASTVFTTIGYGNLVCKTFLGKFITIIYALIGIPLTVVMLNDIGQLIFRKLNFVYNYFRKKTSKGAFVPTDATELKTVPLWIAVAIIFVYVFVCGAVFAIFEEWSYFDGMYFMFISLCTIGFGDVMPNDPHDTLRAAVCLIIGLSLISLCLSIINLSMEEKYRKTITGVETAMEEDNKKLSIKAFQALIYAKHVELHRRAEMQGTVEEQGITILDPDDNLSYPGITLGVISSKPRNPRSRSPSPSNRC